MRGTAGKMFFSVTPHHSESEMKIQLLVTVETSSFGDPTRDTATALVLQAVSNSLKAAEEEELFEHDLGDLLALHVTGVVPLAPPETSFDDPSVLRGVSEEKSS